MAKSISNKKHSEDRLPEFYMPAMPPLGAIHWLEKQVDELRKSLKRRKPKGHDNSQPHSH